MKKLTFSISGTVNKLKNIRLKKATSFVFYETLIALLITQLLIPPQLAFAPPPPDEQSSERPPQPTPPGGDPEHRASVDVEIDQLNAREHELDEKSESAALSTNVLTVEGALNSFLYRSGEVQAEDNRLKEIQEKRDRAVGLDPLRAMVDPYSLLEQTVTVIDKDGVSTTYSVLEDNSNFIRPPPNYRLERDIQVEVDKAEGKLKLVYKALDGKSLPEDRTYIHNFVIPGIHSVMRDKQHIHILLDNGDLKTILMAHSWLFQADMRAQGGSLLVPYVGAVPPRLVDEQSYLIKSPLTLEGFDAIKHQGVDFSQSGADFNDLRVGDIVVRDSSGACTAVIGYTSIIDAITFHLNLLKKRHEMLHGDLGPVESAMSSVNSSIATESSNPTISGVIDRMMRGQDPAEVLPQLQGLSQHIGAMAGDWSRHPLEQRRLTSARLNNQLAFLAAIQSLAANPNTRSTFDHTEEVSPTEFAGTLEAEIQDFLNRNFAPEKESRWKRFTKKTLSLAKYLGVRAGVVGGVSTLVAGVQSQVNDTTVLKELVHLPEAVYNQVLHVLPSTYVFFDLDHKVKLFDLGFVEGPEVFYVAKFAGLFLLSAGVLLALPKYVFSHWDSKVLGRELPKSNFSDGSVAGLTVYYTIALRMMSRLLQSMRSRVAGLFGFADLLESAKMGIPPDVYKRHGGKAVGAVAIRAKLEPVAVLCQEMTLQITLQNLVDKGLIARTDALNVETLRARLGEEGFTHLSERMALLNARIWHLLQSDVTEDREPAKNGRLRELERIVWESEIGTCMVNPTAQLSQDEAAEYKTVKKKMARRNRWMRLAGQNELYYRFRHGEVPENVIREAIGWNSFQDLITMVPFAIIIPPFSDLSHPDLLVAGDYNMTGVVSDKFVAEGMGNAAAWASQTPHEVLVWARATAATLVASYRNPQFMDVTSSVRQQVQAARPATVNESARAYNSGYTGLNFAYAFQKMGHRMSIAEVKGLKILFTVATLIAMWGYAFQYDYAAHGLDQFQASIDYLKSAGGATLDIWWAALVKVTAGAGLAYATYRMLWNWHNLGLRNTEGEIKATMLRYADHISNLAADVVQMLRATREEAKEAFAQGVRKHLTALISFYKQNGRELAFPEQDVNALSGVPLADYAKQVVDLARTSPPVPMSGNGAHKTAVTWTIAGLTTIIGMTAFGYAWQWAEGIEFGTSEMFWVPLIMGAVYGSGKVLDWSGRQVRARFGYKWRVNAMRRLLSNAGSFDRSNPRERQYVFNEIMKVRSLYRHYETDLPPSVLDLDTLTPSSDNLLETADAVYRYMLTNPPEDPTRFSQRVMGRTIRAHEATLSELPVATTVQPGPPVNQSAPGIRPWYIKCRDAILGAVTGQ